MLYIMLILKAVAPKAIATIVHRNIQELPSDLVKCGIKCLNDFFINSIRQGFTKSYC